MSRSLWAVLGLGAVLLLAAVLFQVLRSPTVLRDGRVSAGLAERVPRTLPGWSVRDMPLGETEAVRQTVEDILRYDDFVYRVYTRGDTEIGVYVAYWAPGKMPTRLIEQHTPDRCWVENGWTCREFSSGPVATGTGQPLLPAQWRTYLPPAGHRPVHVLFWLLVGGQNYDFGDRLNRMPNPVRWWRQYVVESAQGYREHYFVRLTSNRSFAELERDPSWKAILQAVAALGLAEANRP